MKMYLQIAVVHLTFWPFVIISLLCIHRSQHCWDAYCGLRSEKNSVLFLYSKKKTDFSPYFSFTLRRVQFHYNKKAKKADTLNGWSLQACILATTTSSPTNLPMSIPVIKIMVKCTLTRPTNITQACTNGGMPMSPFGPVLARLASTFRPFCGAGIIIYLRLKTKYLTKVFPSKGVTLNGSMWRQKSPSFARTFTKRTSPRHCKSILKWPSFISRIDWQMLQ